VWAWKFYPHTQKKVKSFLIRILRIKIISSEILSAVAMQDFVEDTKMVKKAKAKAKKGGKKK